MIIEMPDEHLKNANGKCCINMIYSIFKHKYQEPTVDEMCNFKKGFLLIFIFLLKNTEM